MLCWAMKPGKPIKIYRVLFDAYIERATGIIHYRAVKGDTEKMLAAGPLGFFAVQAAFRRSFLERALHRAAKSCLHIGIRS